MLSGSERALLAFAAIVAVGVGTTLLVRHLKLPENRSKLAAEMEARPVLRTILAFGRRISPQARFVAGRLTPGDLGLELTTALAVLAVGSFVCIGYGLEVDSLIGGTPGDATAADIADDLRAGWLTSVAEVVTALGSGWAVSLVALGTGVWLGVRRHWPELAVLVVGLAAILIGPDLIKDAVDRPRPDGGLVDVSGSAYPSGHAAHSVVYAWIALTIALRLRPKMPAASGLVIAGLAVAAAIGLSRVYLGVHYLSDVNGGWGYGAAAFALLSALAVVVTYFRHNGDG